MGGCLVSRWRDQIWFPVHRRRIPLVTPPQRWNAIRWALLLGGVARPARLEDARQMVDKPGPNNKNLEALGI